MTDDLSLEELWIIHSKRVQPGTIEIISISARRMHTVDKRIKTVQFDSKSGKSSIDQTFTIGQNLKENDTHQLFTDLGSLKGSLRGRDQGFGFTWSIQSEQSYELMKLFSGLCWLDESDFEPDKIINFSFLRMTTRIKLVEGELTVSCLRQNVWWKETIFWYYWI